MEVPLSWERLLWSCRAPLAPWTRYALTDFRLVRQAGSRSDELPIQDVGDIHRRRCWIDRLLGSSTLIVHPRDARRAPFVLAHVRRGAHLAALLELLSGDPRVTWDAESIRSALAWEPRETTGGLGGTTGLGEALLGLGVIAVAVGALAFSPPGRAAAITYPSDDAVYPGGVKKDRAAIVRFMETEVMPWARGALGPLTGGSDAVTCETCHGFDAESRLWQMPAVIALPQPDVTSGGWEVYGGAMDAQMRNAIYGYTAESGNQATAAYMREVVMPGMARLLHRPAYDFTRSYDYNRSHLALGCYHCHRVK
ncbi:MAG: hypothetical protein GEU82_15165 [Luteitalea sp.]|nr:hypothetical protein [Luteitalea sp.]